MKLAQNSVFSKSLELPNLFASYRIRDFPQAGLRRHPWKMTGTQAILLNAFDLLANRRTRKFTPEIKKTNGKLHEYVEFDGPIMLDSGAFNFLRYPEISITPIDVLSTGIELGADIAVVLDHPFLPQSDPEERNQRWSNTLANTRIMFEALRDCDTSSHPNDFRLVPVIHGHDSETLSNALDDIVEILGPEPEIVGVGSLAPLALNGSKRTVVDVILTTRRLIPNAHIHCFSLGSALLMLFAFYCGADTVDSQTWIMSAAFKQVQLPGLHLTRLSRREAVKDAAKYERTRRDFAQHLIGLIENEGFAVKDWDVGNPWPIGDERDALSYIDYLEDRDEVNHVHRRACHNLYAFNFEANRVREEKRANTLETFIHSRMKSTVYSKVFEYAIDEKMKLPTSSE